MCTNKNYRKCVNKTPVIETCCERKMNVKSFVKLQFCQEEVREIGRKHLAVQKVICPCVTAAGNKNRHLFAKCCVLNTRVKGEQTWTAVPKGMKLFAVGSERFSVQLRASQLNPSRSYRDAILKEA